MQTSFSTEVRDTFLNVVFFWYLFTKLAAVANMVNWVYAENGLTRYWLLRLREVLIQAITFDFRNYTWNENKEKYPKKSIA